MMNEKHTFTKDINLKDLFITLKKRVWIILIITALSTIAGIFYSAMNVPTPLYQTSSRIILGEKSDMNTLQVIIRDKTVLEKVINQLDLARSPESLANQINVQRVDESQIVSISVVDTDPNLAAEIANTTAEVFKEEIPKIIDFNDVSILSTAEMNPFPINGGANGSRTIMIALIFGLVAGIGFAFFLDSLDETIKSVKDVEAYLDLPVLGKISKMNKKNIQKQSLHKIDIHPGGDIDVKK
jgi:capsular polysaccharide biosynthesis protein